MSIVFHLPIELITELLSEWVGLIEISKLDRCISHLFVRRKFLDVISMESVVYDGIVVSSERSACYFAWLYSRNISVNRVEIGRGNHVIDLYVLQEKMFRHVKILDFSSGPRIDSFRLPPVLTMCPKLEEFAHCEFDYGNIVDEKVLKALCDHCPNLTSFTLINNYMIGDEHLQLLVKGCTKLRHLHLHSCFRISSSGMKAVAGHCPRLQSLTLRTMEGVTDTGLAAVATSCHQLTQLNITAGMYNITDIHALVAQNPLLHTLTLSALILSDDTLSLIARSCPRLQRLALHRSVGLTDGGVLTLVQACPTLTELDIRSCPKLSAALWIHVEDTPGRKIRCCGVDWEVDGLRRR